MNERRGQLPPEPFDMHQLLDLYLDGELTGDRLREFERALDTDARLRDLVDRQRHIDASLRQSFAMPETARVHADTPIANRKTVQVRDREPVAASSSSRRPSVAARWQIRRPLAIAASIVLLIGVPVIAWNTWRTWSNLQTPASLRGRRGPVQALDVAYRSKLSAGFTSDWECKDQTEFANAFAAALGQPARMRQPSADVKTLGLSYFGGITTDTIGFLATVDDQPVIVFADRAENDKGQRITDTNLRMFKRELGPLVLYEVTPREAPALLDYFYLP